MLIACFIRRKRHENTFFFTLFTCSIALFLSVGAARDFEDVNTNLETNYVASIEDESYETLSEALSAAQSGETITLMQNIIVTPDEMTANAVISLPSNVNLDGNGNTIYASDAWDERFENAFHVISVEQGTSSMHGMHLRFYGLQTTILCLVMRPAYLSLMPTFQGNSLLCSYSVIQSLKALMPLREGTSASIMTVHPFPLGQKMLFPGPMPPGLWLAQTQEI